MVKDRMAGRGFAVGSNPRTGPFLEQNFLEALAVLERHLAPRDFLMGSRPAFGDFGLAPQLYQAPRPHPYPKRNQPDGPDHPIG